MCEQENKRIVLEGDEAIALWQAGKKEWNEWVNQHPVADVNFICVDFASFRTEEKPDISFNQYNFPKGNVSFYGANFGKGDLRFERATFGEGDVDFSAATFGKGDLRFERATFGEGNVDFSAATFGKGDVVFYGATFGKGDVNFRCATFGEGDVDFRCATFGKGDVNFRCATFGKGDLRFEVATFGEGDLRFERATFGEGDVDFSNTTFGEGVVGFHGATFGDGDVSFSNTTFGDGDVSFSNTTFGDGKVYLNVNHFGKGKLLLSNIKCQAISFESRHGKINKSPVFDLTAFSLRGATINGPLVLNNLAFNCIPDLRSTKLSHHVDMDGLEVRPARERGNWKQLFTKTNNEETAQSKLRRLKEIAEQFKHHRQALKFNAQELQATRWTHNKSFFGNGLDILYSVTSDYGQSIKRPFLWLLVSWVSFATIFGFMSDKTIMSFESINHMLGLSIINSLPFITIGKAFQIDILEKYELTLIDNIFIAMSFQNIVSLILIFLLGLGLRNQFRI
ncbi:pentapeptide repeat-containing protein [Glaciecola sp. KUL10]|uniref:pentapeptide repeat-containing protein n=1 Tax=Glaciecola sp. (strain KUL10) TaxID=2161813 RepID=UPI000D7850BF|nr:pentapeptide repeat-containing protein [Glaciecola sp. KUL10]GBL03154.1 hypothetical protein KUL10_04350 [Glaciecola sp. KUL10]